MTVNTFTRNIRHHARRPVFITGMIMSALNTCIAAYATVWAWVLVFIAVMIFIMITAGTTSPSDEDDVDADDVHPCDDDDDDVVDYYTGRAWSVTPGETRAHV